MIEKVEQMNLLLDQYSSLLTQKQLEIANLYYQEDLSLQEIADNISISKNGVYDTLKRVETVLQDYEMKLKLVEKQKKQQDLFAKLVQYNYPEITQIIKHYQEENNE